MNRSNSPNDNGRNPPYQNDDDSDDSSEMEIADPLQVLPPVDQPGPEEMVPSDDEEEDIFDRQWSELTEQSGQIMHPPVYMERRMIFHRHSGVEQLLHSEAAHIRIRIRDAVFSLVNNLRTRVIIPFLLSPLVDNGVFHIVFPEVEGPVYFYLQQNTPEDENSQNEQEFLREADLMLIGYAEHFSKEMNSMGRLLAPPDVSDGSHIHRLGGIPLDIAPGTDIEIDTETTTENTSEVQRNNPMLSDLLGFKNYKIIIKMNNPILTAMLGAERLHEYHILKIVEQFDVAMEESLYELRIFLLRKAYKLVQAVDPELAAEWYQLDKDLSTRCKKSEMKNGVSWNIPPVMAEKRRKVLDKVEEIVRMFPDYSIKEWEKYNPTIEFLDVEDKKTAARKQQIPRSPVNMMVYTARTSVGPPENPSSSPTNSDTPSDPPDNEEQANPDLESPEVAATESSENPSEQQATESAAGDSQSQTKESASSDQQTVEEEVQEEDQSEKSAIDEQVSTSGATQTPACQATESNNSQIDEQTARITEMMGSLPTPSADIVSDTQGYMGERFEASIRTFPRSTTPRSELAEFVSGENLQMMVPESSESETETNPTDETISDPNSDIVRETEGPMTSTSETVATTQSQASSVCACRPPTQTQASTLTRYAPLNLLQQLGIPHSRSYFAHPRTHYPPDEVDPVATMEKYLLTKDRHPRPRRPNAPLLPLEQEDYDAPTKTTGNPKENQPHVPRSRANPPRPQLHSPLCTAPQGGPPCTAGTNPAIQQLGNSDNSQQSTPEGTSSTNDQQSGSSHEGAPQDGTSTASHTETSGGSSSQTGTDTLQIGASGTGSSQENQERSSAPTSGSIGGAPPTDTSETGAEETQTTRRRSPRKKPTKDAQPKPEKSPPRTRSSSRSAAQASTGKAAATETPSEATKSPRSLRTSDRLASSAGPSSGSPRQGRNSRKPSESAEHMDVAPEGSPKTEKVSPQKRSSSRISSRASKGSEKDSDRDRSRSRKRRKEESTSGAEGTNQQARGTVTTEHCPPPSSLSGNAAETQQETSTRSTQQYVPSTTSTIAESHVQKPTMTAPQGLPTPPTVSTQHQNFPVQSPQRSSQAQQQVPPQQFLIPATTSPISERQSGRSTLQSPEPSATAPGIQQPMPVAATVQAAPLDLSPSTPGVNQRSSRVAQCPLILQQLRAPPLPPRPTTEQQSPSRLVPSQGGGPQIEGARMAQPQGQQQHSPQQQFQQQLQLLQQQQRQLVQQQIPQQRSPQHQQGQLSQQQQQLSPQQLQLQLAQQQLPQQRSPQHQQRQLSQQQQLLSPQQLQFLAQQQVLQQQSPQHQQRQLSQQQQLLSPQQLQFLAQQQVLQQQSPQHQQRQLSQQQQQLSPQQLQFQLAQQQVFQQQSPQHQQRQLSQQHQQLSPQQLQRQSPQQQQRQSPQQRSPAGSSNRSESGENNSPRPVPQLEGLGMAIFEHISSPGSGGRSSRRPSCPETTLQSHVEVIPRERTTGRQSLQTLPQWEQRTSNRERSDMEFSPQGPEVEYVTQLSNERSPNRQVLVEGLAFQVLETVRRRSGSQSAEENIQTPISADISLEHQESVSSISSDQIIDVETVSEFSSPFSIRSLMTEPYTIAGRPSLEGPPIQQQYGRISSRENQPQARTPYSSRSTPEEMSPDRQSRPITTTPYPRITYGQTELRQSVYALPSNIRSRFSSARNPQQGSQELQQPVCLGSESVRQQRMRTPSTARASREISLPYQQPVRTSSARASQESSPSRRQQVVVHQQQVLATAQGHDPSLVSQTVHPIYTSSSMRPASLDVPSIHQQNVPTLPSAGTTPEESYQQHVIPATATRGIQYAGSMSANVTPTHQRVRTTSSARSSVENSPARRITRGRATAARPYYRRSSSSARGSSSGGSQERQENIGAHMGPVPMYQRMPSIESPRVVQVENPPVHATQQTSSPLRGVATGMSSARQEHVPPPPPYRAQQQLQQTRRQYSSENVAIGLPPTQPQIRRQSPSGSVPIGILPTQQQIHPQSGTVPMEMSTLQQQIRRQSLPVGVSMGLSTQPQIRPPSSSGSLPIGTSPTQQQQQQVETPPSSRRLPTNGSSTHSVVQRLGTSLEISPRTWFRTASGTSVRRFYGTTPRPNICRNLFNPAQATGEVSQQRSSEVAQPEPAEQVSQPSAPLEVSNPEATEQSQEETPRIEIQPPERSEQRPSREVSPQGASSMGPPELPERTEPPVSGINRPGTPMFLPQEDSEDEDQEFRMPEPKDGGRKGRRRSFPINKKRQREITRRMRRSASLPRTKIYPPYYLRGISLPYYPRPDYLGRVERNPAQPFAEYARSLSSMPKVAKPRHAHLHKMGLDRYKMWWNTAKHSEMWKHSTIPEPPRPDQSGEPAVRLSTGPAWEVPLRQRPLELVSPSKLSKKQASTPAPNANRSDQAAPEDSPKVPADEDQDNTQSSTHTQGSQDLAENPTIPIPCQAETLQTPAQDSQEIPTPTTPTRQGGNRGVDSSIIRSPFRQINLPQGINYKEEAADKEKIKQAVDRQRQQEKPPIVIPPKPQLVLLSPSDLPVDMSETRGPPPITIQSCIEREIVSILSESNPIVSPEADGDNGDNEGPEVDVEEPGRDNNEPQMVGAEAQTLGAESYDTYMTRLAGPPTEVTQVPSAAPITFPTPSAEHTVREAIQSLGEMGRNLESFAARNIQPISPPSTQSSAAAGERRTTPRRSPETVSRPQAAPEIGSLTGRTDPRSQPPLSHFNPLMSLIEQEIAIGLGVTDTMVQSIPYQPSALYGSSTATNIYESQNIDHTATLEPISDLQRAISESLLTASDNSTRGTPNSPNSPPSEGLTREQVEYYESYGLTAEIGPTPHDQDLPGLDLYQTHSRRTSESSVPGGGSSSSDHQEEEAAGATSISGYQESTEDGRGSSLSTYEELTQQAERKSPPTTYEEVTQQTRQRSQLSTYEELIQQSRQRSQLSTYEELIQQSRQRSQLSTYEELIQQQSRQRSQLSTYEELTQTERSPLTAYHEATEAARLMRERSLQRRETIHVSSYVMPELSQQIPIIQVSQRLPPNPPPPSYTGAIRRTTAPRRNSSQTSTRSSRSSRRRVVTQEIERLHCEFCLAVLPQAEYEDHVRNCPHKDNPVPVDDFSNPR